MILVVLALAGGGVPLNSHEILDDHQVLKVPGPRYLSLSAVFVGPSPQLNRKTVQAKSWQCKFELVGNRCEHPADPE